LTSEKSCIEKVIHNTLNAPFSTLKKENKGNFKENERIKNDISNREIKIYHDENEEGLRKTLELSNIISKKRNSKSNMKDKIGEILEEFINRFTINYTRNIIKKTLVVFTNMMNKKFEEKISLFNNIHDQIASIEMMINAEMGNFNANKIYYNLTSINILKIEKSICFKFKL